MSTPNEHTGTEQKQGAPAEERLADGLFEVGLLLWNLSHEIETAQDKLDAAKQQLGNVMRRCKHMREQARGGNADLRHRADSAASQPKEILDEK